MSNLPIHIFNLQSNCKNYIYENIKQLNDNCSTHTTNHIAPNTVIACSMPNSNLAVPTPTTSVPLLNPYNLHTNPQNPNCNTPDETIDEEESEEE